MRAFPGQLLFVAEYQDVVALWSTSDLKMFGPSSDIIVQLPLGLPVIVISVLMGPDSSYLFVLAMGQLGFVRSDLLQPPGYHHEIN